jgi:hypothetical protein
VVFEVMCLFTLNGHYSGREKIQKIFFWLITTMGWIAQKTRPPSLACFLAGNNGF